MNHPVLADLLVVAYTVYHIRKNAKLIQIKPGEKSGLAFSQPKWLRYSLPAPLSLAGGGPDRPRNTAAPGSTGIPGRRFTAK
jgi:hypothetical protein